MFRHIFSKQNRALLAELVRTDFKLRYQGSFLGYAWSLLRPLFLFLILYVVFSKLGLGTGIPYYPVYLLLGIVMWNFFAEMTAQSLGSIVGRGDLIRKIRIPRWTIVISSSFSALINFALNLIVVFIFMLITHVDFLHTSLWLPLIFIEVYLFALGLSLFLAAAFVRFRDIGYIWDVIMQAFFYLTPIIYALSRIHSLLMKKLMFINPMAQAIQDARHSAITHQTITISTVFDGVWYKLIPFAIVLVVLVGGTLYFKSQASSFAENI